MRRQVMIILPQLNDCGGNLLSSWFVHYSCRNPKTNKLDRFRIYTGFKSLSTGAGRRKHAESLIKKYTEKLKSGWTPYLDDEVVIYEDQVTYEQIAKNFGRKQKSVQNVRVLVSQFLSRHKSNWAIKSYQTYQSKLRTYANWTENNQLSKRDIALMTKPVLIEFFDFLIQKGLAERTILKYKQVLYRFFEDLKEDKIIIDNPAIGIQARGKVVDQSAKPILKDDINLLKKEIQLQDPQLWLACEFQYYCFIRPGTELRLLKIQDINLHSRTITIISEKAKNRITEMVQIPTQFLNDLTGKYRLQDWPKDYYVFGQHGHPGPVPMGRNTFPHRFNVIRDALNLSKDYKFYSWKHTGATAAVDAGIPERHLMNQLRHKSFESTDHYFRRHVGWRSTPIQDEFPDI